MNFVKSEAALLGRVTQILSKIILECNNYKINNPFQKKEKLKHKLMRNAFIGYTQIRIKLSEMLPKLFPLKEWKNMWMERSSPFKEEDNSVTHVYDYENNKMVEAYFNLESMHIFEIVPKEEIDDIIEGIRRFKSKHGNGYNIYHFDASTKDFKDYWSGIGFTLLDVVGIDKSSKIYKYGHQIRLRVINLTNSFYVLSVTVFLNKELTNSISRFITSNVREKIDVSLVGKKWSEFTNLGNTYISGKVIKREILEEILTDIKWKVSSLLSSYIPKMILFSHKVNLPSITSFRTNIDGNSYGEFWESIDVNPRHCDFLENFSGCLAWGTASTNPKYIYSQHKQLDSLSSTILAHDIDIYVSPYLVADAVDKDFRKQLRIFSEKMNHISKKGTKHWLKIKIKFDATVLYYSRFINEYQNKKNELPKLIRLSKRKIPIIDIAYKNLKNRIDEDRKLYKTIMSLFQSNADYRNLNTNLRIQKIILISTIISVAVAIISACVAILALFVTAQTATSANENLGTIIDEAFDFMWSFFKSFSTQLWK
ncbi:hypothetical protein IJ21_46210 [Paenibacillus sp. 32O-W]|uniref:hypothetical protein n=1 Tax=Paenibacillus sp. 32O-W TaxID=1695218 RepID=UPI000720D8C2|nr:hypothetical protein [Paenibacillus sp. 32O-W]ALS29984.1 hypothetical protein IJ21_46210 [Paenibacillus sp. 32O-W]